MDSVITSSIEIDRAGGMARNCRRVRPAR